MEKLSILHLFIMMDVALLRDVMIFAVLNFCLKKWYQGEVDIG